jgi:hypothetical protein
MVADSVTVDADTSLVVSLTRKKEVLVIVMDRATGEPVYRAEIHYGDITRGTDYSGTVLIDDPIEKEFVYTVGHSDYFTLTDSVTVTGDTSLVVVLTRKLADIHFEVSDSMGSLAGASVTINGWEILTGSGGTAWFNSQLARQQYGYTVELAGYRTVSDSLYLDIDTTLTVILEPATGIDGWSRVGAMVFPNPAGDIICIRIVSDNAEVLLMNSQGKVMIGKRIYRGLNTMDVSGLPSGLYFLSIMGNTGIACRKIMLKH